MTARPMTNQTKPPRPTPAQPAPMKPVPKQPAPGSPPPDRPPTGTAPRRRGRRLFAVGFVIVAVFTGAAVGYSLRLQPTMYGSSAEFIVTPRPELSDAAVERAMLTQVMVMTSDPVLRPVAGQAAMPLPRLRAAISAEIVGRSNVLHLQVADRDQARATRLVVLITDEYLRRAAPPAPAAGADGAQEPPATRSGLLSAATPLDAPVQPRPMQALAGGLLIGLLVAAVTVTVLIGPRRILRPVPHWE